MKSYSSIKLKIAIFLTLIAIASSCTTLHKPDKNSSNYFEETNVYSAKLYQQHKLSEAKLAIYEAIATRKPVTSPYVENNTLYTYALNSTQNMSALLSAASFFTVRDKDSVKKNPGIYKEYFDIYNKTPWKDAVTIYPNYPILYFTLGSIYNEEKNYPEAIKYLDTAIYIWNGNGSVWSELIYSYMSMRNFSKAKEIGDKALKINEVSYDNTGKAAILRKLGFIAVEENDLDKAENYYNESLNCEYSEYAQNELRYIKELKSKKGR